MHHGFVLTAMILLAGVTSAQAAAWDEAVQGDMSDNGLAPSFLQLQSGSNRLQGSFGRPDRDYLSVVVPDGLQLSALRAGAGMVIGGVRSFIGVQAGAQVTVPPDSSDISDAAPLLGYTHVQFAVPGTDFLPDIGQAYGAIGFVGALPAGTYSFWIQETSGEPGLRYDLDLEVSAVPEPQTARLLLLGLGLIGSVYRLRSGASAQRRRD